MTEGFGIVGPMSGEAERPSWGFLGADGPDRRRPDLPRHPVGQAWVSPALEVAFFAVAGGSILYVVIQLFEVAGAFSLPTLVAWSLLLGLLARLRRPTGSSSPPEPDRYRSSGSGPWAPSSTRSGSSSTTSRRWTGRRSGSRSCSTSRSSSSAARAWQNIIRAAYPGGPAEAPICARRVRRRRRRQLDRARARRRPRQALPGQAPHRATRRTRRSRRRSSSRRCSTSSSPAR